MVLGGLMVPSGFAADPARDAALMRLEIKDVQGGFAGFTGQLWVIEPSGQWSRSRVFNEKIEVEQKGMLSKDELAKLARALARYDPATLKSTGKVGVNPHVVTIKYGPNEASLTLGAGAPLPKVDPKNDKPSLPERYSGIVTAVMELVKEKKEK
jgi:hypothetical protein